MELRVKRVLEVGRQLFKTFSLEGSCVIFCLVLLPFVNCYIGSLEERYEDLSPTVEYVKSLNTNTIAFRQRHHLHGSGQAPENFRNLIDNHTKKYKMKVVQCEKISQLSLNTVKVNKYRIEVLSWHDCYIFEMIGKMQKLSPGVINFEKICISRISRVNLRSPSIKAVLLCNLYYKD